MKLFYLTVVLCWLSFGASAQMKDRQPEAPSCKALQVSAEELTRQMSTRLQLNEAQFIKLLVVNEIRLSKLDEIQWLYEQNADERQARMTELEAQYQRECQSILTPTQISVLQDEQQHDAVPTEPSPTNNGLG